MKSGQILISVINDYICTMNIIHPPAICAISTPQFKSAISVIRTSGKNCFELLVPLIRFRQAGKELAKLKGLTVHRAAFIDNGETLDDVLITVFREPNSYTGENLVEISCHGSVYIQKKILEALIENGFTLARPGEFTMRAFVNGKIDLSEAEAISDLISSETRAAHNLALKQLLGGFKKELGILREKLVKLSSLIELELDFSEEDVEFANRVDLIALSEEILKKVEQLKDSFKEGNIIKNGITICITGDTNVGKSSLLNSILRYERAIVTPHPGTTRDFIEETFSYNGILFRIYDTAGIREPGDEIEKTGILKTWEKINDSEIILIVIDSLADSDSNKSIFLSLYKETSGSKTIFLVLNKIDALTLAQLQQQIAEYKQLALKHKILLIPVSAKENTNIDEILVNAGNIAGNLIPERNEVIVYNTRHLEALQNAVVSLRRTIAGIKENLTTDLIAQDIRETLFHLGEITGTVANKEILDSIFRDFCIGK